MPRFFVEEEPWGRYLLGGENGRHVLRSLRMHVGEELTLCDGTGFTYPCRLVADSEEGAWVQVEGKIPGIAELKEKITLCQCLPKGDKMEQIVQKTVELGMGEFWPLESRNCVVKLGEKERDKKTARWQKIALEAAKQSGRDLVPPVRRPLPLEKALAQAAGQGEVFFFYEKGAGSLTLALEESARLGEKKELFLFVGPEGGFDPGEVALAEKLGAKILSLGKRILRTETAPVAALAAIAYARGEME